MHDLGGFLGKLADKGFALLNAVLFSLFKELEFSCQLRVAFSTQDWVFDLDVPWHVARVLATRFYLLLRGYNLIVLTEVEVRVVVMSLVLGH